MTQEELFRDTIHAALDEVVEPVPDLVHAAMVRIRSGGVPRRWWAPTAQAAMALAFATVVGAIVLVSHRATVSRTPATPQATGPSPRYAAAITYDPQEQAVLVFGGETRGAGASNGALWAWNGKSWHQLSPAGLPPVYGAAAMAYDEANNQLVLFGGQGPGSKDTNVTWTWSGKAWVQQHPQHLPPPRHWPSFVYDPATARVLLFGGFSYSGAGSGVALGDTWTWDGKDWLELHPRHSPAARGTAAVAYDLRSQAMVLFGGSAAGQEYGDTWIWNGTDWIEQHPAISPAARSAAAMVFDSAHDQLVLFSETPVSTDSPNDTWVWRSGQWAQLSPLHSPVPRGYASVAYDPGAQQMVMFGGFGFPPGGGPPRALGDTWTWTGDDWILRAGKP